jgi:DNA replication protein DnaC
LMITGATGCGNTYLACALAHSALRAGHTACYLRAPRLLDELSVGRAIRPRPRPAGAHAPARAR